MNVRFISPDARQRAKPILDALLESGTEQIAIACAFLSPGGVELLKRHAARLRLPDSFVVVAWESATSLAALNDLYTLIPGKLYIHLGSLTPVERGVGPGMMHSKVFFAKSGRECRVWTGSHNLTASATQGVNREAAIVIEGTADEGFFADVLQHLNECRSEATLFDPLQPPPPLTSQQTLVIHAECDTGLKISPWFVHLRPDTTEYDNAMRPPAAVWLYLYEPGSLRIGQRRPPAIAVYSGMLTALNFTERHPRHVGIPADWREADYVVEIESGVPHLREPNPKTTTPSQGIFRVDQRENPEIVWLTASPVPKIERLVGERRLSDVDSEFRQFFTKSSLRGDRLLHQEYRSLKSVTQLPRKEVGSVNALELQDRLPVKGTELIIHEDLDQEDKFAFIYRAKYRA